MSDRNDGEETTSKSIKQKELGGYFSKSFHEVNRISRPFVLNPPYPPPPVEGRDQSLHSMEEIRGITRIHAINSHHFGNGGPLAPQQFFGATNLIL